MNNRITELVKKAKAEGFVTKKDIDMFVWRGLFTPTLEDLESDDFSYC